MDDGRRAVLEVCVCVCIQCERAPIEWEKNSAAGIKQ